MEKIMKKKAKELDMKGSVREIRRLISKGYQFKQFDDVLNLRYVFLCWKRGCIESIKFNVRYDDLVNYLSKVSPGLAKTYEGIDLQIQELSKQKVEIMIGLVEHVSFPVAQ